MESEAKDLIKKKLNELEEKSRLYKLKRYEKNNMKKYRKILFFNDKKELIVEQMKENQKKFEIKIKEEKEYFFKEKEIIQKKKKQLIKLIEDNKKSKIQESNKRFKNLISYLDSIKNDKNKLIDFFKNVNYF